MCTPEFCASLQFSIKSDFKLLLLLRNLDTQWTYIMLGWDAHDLSHSPHVAPVMAAAASSAAEGAGVTASGKHLSSSSLP
jgi:hypothetical protein